MDPHTNLHPPSHSAPIIDRAPLPIVEVHGSKHIVSYVNAAFCNLLKKRSEDLIGKSFCDIVQGGDQCTPFLDKVYETGEAATLSHPDSAKENRAFWLYSMWPSLDEHQCPMGVIIQLTRTDNFRDTAADINEALLISGLQQQELAEKAELLNVSLQKEITERKFAQEELREREQQLQLAITSANMGCWRVNLQTGLGTRDANLNHILGRPPLETTQAMPEFFDFIHPDDRPGAMAAWAQAIESKGSYDSEIRIVLPGGVVRWLQDKGRFIPGEDTGTDSITGITLDITKRKLDEQKFRGLLESAPDAMIITDKAGNITLINHQTEKIFGYKPGELTGRPIEVLIPARFRPEHPGHRKDFLGDPKVRPMGAALELWALRKDGSEFPVEISLSPLQTEEGILVTAAVRDITKRRLIEADLRQAKDLLARQAGQLDILVQQRTAALRAAVGELEAFSYSVAHDLRAPLRSIQGYAQSLLEDQFEQLDETGKEYLQRISRSALRMNTLIQDVLSYTTVLRGEAPLNQVGTERLLRDIIEGCPNWQEPHAEISIEGLLPRIFGNEALLGQCFTNILSNAVKFVSPGTKPRIRIWAESVENFVRVTISDNGVGVARENHQRIFRMFERIYPATEFEGTGIGLTIVRKAVERMNGRVGFDSELGQGSRFWIELQK